MFRRGKWSSNSILYFSEIGIGEDKDEAFKNYGKFDYEENTNFAVNFDRIKNN